MQAPWKYIDQILNVLREEPPELEGPPVPDNDSEVVPPVPMGFNAPVPNDEDEGIADEPVDMG